MTKYEYNGPVLMFGKVVANNWKGETMAITRKKALNNLSFQFKTLYNLGGKITLVDKYLYELSE